MAFRHSLSTRDMAEYVTYHFKCDRRRVAFPPLPLPNDFQALCRSYELAVAEEATYSIVPTVSYGRRNFGKEPCLPRWWPNMFETPFNGLSARTFSPRIITTSARAIFYAMVVNDAMALGLTCKLTAECMMWVMVVEAFVLREGVYKLFVATGPSTLGRSVLNKRGCSPVGLILEIVAEGPEFPGALIRSDPQDGLGSYFPNPKVVPTLKRMNLEKKYLLPVGSQVGVTFLTGTRVSQSGIPFRAPTVEEKKMAHYFHYFIREDDKPWPIPKFMAQAIELVKGPERRKSKSSDRKPLNWLPKLKASEGAADGLRASGAQSRALPRIGEVAPCEPVSQEGLYSNPVRPIHHDPPSVFNQ
ncbi:hypothetical protein Cgig2_033940 [Carnegiea gigantea]|uniref:Uncharacterized protein n=1 Tax=Carnegiea gigantea TaxID=171969 RepID=A0A9Q1GSI1_9CARY|nr:hypothetical protein Cgig2_033940 [Carnegiea gigantea]